MLIKRSYFAGEYDGEPLVRVLRPGEMEKVSGLAPEAQKFCDCLKPDPRYTYVLCNAMGYSEFYGSNSNKDWYGYNPNIDFNGLLHSWDDIGCNVEADRMKGKAWPYGYPCFYGATVYAHHKNTDPQQLGFGDVIFAALNPAMKRVELVKRVFNDEAAKKGHTSILDRVRAGERVDVSMGCKVPFDLCSICTDWDQVKKAWKTYDESRHRHPGIAILEYHKKVQPIRGLAVTKVDYCQHMISEGGKVYPDGRKVFVYNDFPRFFDISFVWIGADRTARVMWHMSSPDAPTPAPRMSGAPPGMLEKLLNMLSSKVSHASTKRSMIEKEIPGGVSQAAFRDSDTTPELSMSVIVRGSGSDPRKVLSTLAALGIIPTPGEFQSLVLPEMAGGDGLKRALDENNATFDTRYPGVDNTYAVSAGHYDAKLASAFSVLMEERSSFYPFLTSRMVSGGTKTASARRVELSAPLLNKVAAMYNGFRISVLEQAPSLFPKSAEYLDLDLLSGGEGAGIEPELGELLLGQGPVIQLISSHLRRHGEEGSQISKMAKLIADNSSFDAMHTIGAALRQTMMVDKTSSLMQAAEHLFGTAGQVV